jgi:hypothetical protein
MARACCARKRSRVVRGCTGLRKVPLNRHGKSVNNGLLHGVGVTVELPHVQFMPQEASVASVRRLPVEELDVPLADAARRAEEHMQSGA